MSYDIYYHLGDHMDLSSDIHKGTLTLEDDGLVIEGDGPELRCTYREVERPAQYFRLHFLCRMLEIQTRKGNAFVTIALVAAAGKPVISNFLRLTSLQTDLDPRVRRAWIRESTYQTIG